MRRTYCKGQFIHVAPLLSYGVACLYLAKEEGGENR